MMGEVVYLRKMEKACLTIVLILTLISCDKQDDNSFWGNGEAYFAVEKVFTGGRFPNLVVALDGTLVATWGNSRYEARRSRDGGMSWDPVIKVADPGFQGGGVIVDETTGDILAFVEAGHPIAPLTMYRSRDHGLSWMAEEIRLHPDENGNVPSMHMNERRITLHRGPHPGRLIRPTRYYANGNDRAQWPEHYTNAIYSDDGGKNWYTSAPFPAMGTGEAALEELSDGSIYYNSRRHLSTDGLDPRRRHIAWSYDGGETWEDLSVSPELPDGDQDRDYGLMGGLVRLPLDGHDILLFSNIDSQGGRQNGTVWASFDGGKSWPVKRVVEKGDFAYSSMAAGRAGTPSEGMVYLFYEGTDAGETAGYVARFNLPWITQGRDWRDFLPFASSSEKN